MHINSYCWTLVYVSVRVCSYLYVREVCTYVSILPTWSVHLYWTYGTNASFSFVCSSNHSYSGNALQNDWPGTSSISRTLLLLCSRPLPISPVCQARLIHICCSHRALLLTSACDQATQNSLGHCLGEDGEESESWAPKCKIPDRESFFTPTFCACSLCLWCYGCKLNCLVNRQSLGIKTYLVISDKSFYLCIILLSYPRCLQTCSMYVFWGGRGSWG